MFFIYIIENKINGRSYVGQTSDPEFRWRKHRKASLDCPYLHRAIRKYGRKNFDFTLIQRCESAEEANTQEIYWITRLGTLAPNGYNLKEGGLGGGLDSLETRLKKSFSKQGKRNSFYGKKHSDESKRKISEAKKGQKLQLTGEDLLRRQIQKTFLGKAHSAETRAKMKAAHTGEKHNFFGKTHSEETKRKMSESRRKWWKQQS